MSQVVQTNASTSRIRFFSYDRYLLGVIAVAVAIRYAFAPFARGFGYDMESFVDWARILLSDPFTSFYARAASPDHLPGDLWFLWAAAHLFTLFGGTNLDGTPFLVVIKTISIVADCCVGTLIYAILKHLRSERVALVASTLYLLNPASIFMSAIWGQWDAVSVALLLLGIWFALQRGDRWMLGVPFIAWALMIKPQLVLLVPFVLAIPVGRRYLESSSAMSTVRWGVPRAVAAFVAGIATVSLVGLPFGVGLPGTGSEWPLMDRLDYALNIWQFTTMGAFNLWMIPVASLSTFERHSDLESGLFGLSLHAWGVLLLLLGYAGIVGVTARRMRSQSIILVLIWGALAVSYAFFMLPTRVHERYLFPAFVISILFAGLLVRSPLAWTYALLVSGSFSLNLMAVYWHWPNALTVAGACLNCALFICVFAVGPGRDAASSDVASKTEPGARTTRLERGSRLSL